MDSYDTLLTRIYDCAANPDLWQDTLISIRDEFGCAYASLFFGDSTSSAQTASRGIAKSSPWDEQWLAKLVSMVDKIPKVESMYLGEIDTAWIQLRQISEEEMRKTEFFKEWVEPQGLRDALNMVYVRRPGLIGTFSLVKSNGSADFTDEQALLAERLSPHIRRAMAINDIVDKGKLAQSMLKSTLDRLASAVLIIGPGLSVSFANGEGEAFLASNDFISVRNNILTALVGGPGGIALCDAIDRASQGDINVGIRGIGVPLVSSTGERHAAYVLPLAGTDMRADLGRGHVAVFIAKRQEQQPALIEILRTLFDMTLAEARVATFLAQGQSPAGIAAALGTSVNTVRSQLAKAYAKSDTPDQAALVSLINSLTLPLASSA